MSVKIVWITDFDCIAGIGGGAELSDRAVIKEGFKRGYDIEVITPNSPTREMAYTADVAVISNASLFPLPFLAQLLDRLLVVNYIHDYFPLCAYRLYYPELPKCKTTCRTRKFAEDFISKAALNVFLSPMHYQLWKRAISQVDDVPHYLHPSPIDTEMFKLMPVVERLPGSVLGVNVLLGFKGKLNVLKYVLDHPGLMFTFCGSKDDDVKLPSNATWIDVVPYIEMPGMYAQAERVIHLPSSVEPFGRIAAEAKLCGTGFIGNKLVGALSYNEYHKMTRNEYAAWIAGAPRRFWNKVKKEVL